MNNVENTVKISLMPISDKRLALHSFSQNSLLLLVLCRGILYQISSICVTKYGKFGWKCLYALW